jgi:hypothetical protein
MFARSRDRRRRAGLNRRTGRKWNRGSRKCTKPVAHHFTHDLPRRFRLRRNNLHLKVGAGWRRPNTRHPNGSGKRRNRPATGTNRD